MSPHFGITSHTIVRNEDRFIWFAINSVLPFIDQLIIYDTGSTDTTPTIIKSISSPKIIFEPQGSRTAAQITKLRQQQLNRTHTPWFLILDGDEVWYQQSIQAVLATAKSKPHLYGIITPTINCVGDIYHYQEAAAGKYTFAGRTGHLAVRAMRRLQGLTIKTDYPLEGYYDSTGHQLTDYPHKLAYVDRPYLHLTNLSRSTTSESTVISREKKYELGIPVGPDFIYPEVFLQPRPDMVPDPWTKASASDHLRAMVETPLKLIKRRVLH